MKQKRFPINILLYFCLISLLFIFMACGDEGETTKTTDSTEDGANGQTLDGTDGVQPPANGEEPPAVPAISFAKDVKPIFDANCNNAFCHGANPPSGLLLTSYDNFKKGGNSGATFIPKDSKGSLIIKRIGGGGMPPGGQLPEEQINKIKDWIDAGGENN